VAISGGILLRHADDALATTTTDGNLVLLDRDYEYLRLNETASRIWELLEEPRSADELVVILSDEFGIAPAVCREGLVPLVETLERRGLLVVTDR
jgi:hypothetical protein